MLDLRNLDTTTITTTPTTTTTSCIEGREIK